jgi:hypothetical protein
MKKVIFGILMALSLFSCRDKNKTDNGVTESVVIVEGSECYNSSIRYNIYVEYSGGGGDTLRSMSKQPSFSPCQNSSDGNWCLTDSYNGSLIAKNVKFFKVTGTSLDTASYVVCTKGK